MGLQDALRKAAGLLVELPPETSANDEGIGDLSNDDAPVADRLGREELDVNALLAEQGIGPRARHGQPRDPQTHGSQGNAPGSETKTVEQIVREADGPNLDEIGSATTAQPQPSATGSVDCAAIYAAAKLPPAAFSAEQMLEMLESLPKELPLDTKRQTVKVTLGALGKTMGATPETIVADASRKMAALAAYEEHLSKRTQEFVAKTEEEITALQAQVEEKRKAIMNTRQELTNSTTMCEAESDRLDDVLEFFSLDVPPSKLAHDAGSTPPTGRSVQY